MLMPFYQKPRGQENMGKKEEEIKIDEKGEIVKRLDALIRLFFESNPQMDKTTFVKTLYSTGLSPLEIAKITGKSKASDVSCYLYDKPKKKKGKKNG